MFIVCCQQNEMLCTKHIIVFYLENSFPIMLSDETREHYMKIVWSREDNNIMILYGNQNSAYPECP